MAGPILLYSTNTWVAYMVGERYYKGVHYVWCSPYFNSRSKAVIIPKLANPPTSTPGDIYHSLAEDVARGDRHSAKVQANRLGIIRGASVKKAAGVITDSQEAEIVAIATAAELSDFRPLLFVIPF